MKNSVNRLTIILIVVMTQLMGQLALAGGHAIAVDNLRTVLITGANRGLGFEFAKQYAGLGWKVIATARKPAEAEDLQALAKEYSNISIEELDVNDLPEVAALGEKYAGQPIDVLINNAALSGSPSPKQLFGKGNYDVFDNFMNTNTRGPLAVTEAFYKNVKASQMKRIVAISSKGGSFSSKESTTRGTMFYRVSKAALNMLMLNIADYVKKDDVIVVIMNPGLVDTQDILGKMNEKMNLGLTLTPIEDSVRGMRKIIDDATLETSGLWYQWNGDPLGF